MKFRWWLCIALSLFISGLVLGLVASGDIGEILADSITELGEFSGLLVPLPQSMVLAVIFFKNVTAVLISFVFSPFLLIVPVIALTINGGMIGWISVEVVQQESLGYLLAGLLPHGVFELPAFIIGEAVALSFGVTVMLAIFRKDKRDELLPSLKGYLKYLGIVVVLLLVAAVMEAYVTPLLLG